MDPLIEKELFDLKVLLQMPKPSSDVLFDQVDTIIQIAEIKGKIREKQLQRLAKEVAVTTVRISGQSQLLDSVEQ
jgi:hypothetical protein